MHKLISVVLAVCLLVTAPAITATKKKTVVKKTPPDAAATTTQPSNKCPSKLADCGDEGCSTDHEFDGNLNRRKNLTPDDPATKGAAEPMTLDAMKKLPNPKHFVMGGPRDELTAAGEGKKVQVTAFLLTVRAEEGESCNCELDDKKQKDKDVGVNTDNHLVLVSGSTVKKFPLANGADVKQWKANLAQREMESITVEFTPRVRLTHPNFTKAAVSPLILKAPQLALPVRITGMLMFDSEHFIRHPLHRVNNWEVHPILKFEFCPKGVKCTADSDAGWKSLDEV